MHFRTLEMSLKVLSGNLPDNQLKTDFSNLSMLNVEQMTELSSLCLQSLSASNEELTDNMRTFSQSNRINSKTFDSLVNSLTYFFAEAVKKSLKPTELQDDLITLSFDEQLAHAVSQTYREHFATLSYAALDATLKVSNLVDMEWRFGVTAGTSDLAETGTCFLQLKLVLEKAGVRDNVLMEITLEQFYSFLSALQKAAAEVENL